MADYYQFELNDNANNALSDITTITQEKKGSYRLNRAAIWTGKTPCDQPEAYEVAYDGFPNLSKNRRLKVRRNGTIVFNGIMMKVHRRGDKNQAWADWMAVDPVIWWKNRPVRDANGNLITPEFGDEVSGADILYACIQNSLATEGPMGLEIATGTYDTYGPGVPNMSMTIADMPKMIGDLATTITNTGTMDFYLEYLDTFDGFDDDLMARLNAVTQHGDDQPSVSFDYGTGDHSIDAVEHIDSMETLCNKLYHYFGPRITDERWQGLVTLDDNMPGQPISVLDRQELLRVMAADSRERFGVWMDIDINETAGQERSVARPLYEILWQTELYLRVNGRELVNFTPSADCPYKPFVDYNLGDTPRVNIDSYKFGVGFDNVLTRIYGFEVMPDDEGVERMGQMVTSADQE